MSDVILDHQAYNEYLEDITWEESSLRSWLNEKFINRAFSDEEKENINITEIVNQDNPEYGTEGGNNTSDKIFLLSLSEVLEEGDGKKYGFLNDETRRCKTNSFSKGARDYWWLRSPGIYGCNAAKVGKNGWVYRYGGGVSYNGVSYNSDGVRPVLHLNLSSSNIFSYAGTVSSDGTENEVPYNTRTRLVQN